MVNAGLVDAETAQVRPNRERWKQALRKDLAECRRSVEVGSAYGYLLDADRGQIESELARWEAQLEEQRRFDVVTLQIKQIRDRVANAREASAQKVRAEMRDITLTEDRQSAVADVERALVEGDIATANEIVHWIAQGKPTPTDLDEEEREGFDRFFPTAMQIIENWLEGQRREVIEHALRQGQVIPGLEAPRIAGAQREQSAKMFAAWSDMKSQQAAAVSRLESLLTGLGFTVKALHRIEQVSGREVWKFDA
jgi:hypothetical protein